jgi:hypothetical protein
VGLQRSEECLNFSSIFRALHRWQRIHKVPAVIGFCHSWIEDRDNAPIASAPDKPTSALSKKSGRTWNVHDLERIGTSTFTAGLKEWIVRPRERESIDRDEAESGAGNVNPLPESHRCEQAGFRVVGESFDEGRFGVIVLTEDRKIDTFA